MDIIICDKNQEFINEWNKVDISNMPFLKVEQGDILKLTAHAFVSPANSFGFMDGGIDYSYVKFFGKQVEDKLKATINSMPMKELLVGQAIPIPTDKFEVPYLICAPTMRVPMELPKDSVNVYLATKAAIICAWKLRYINSIVFPGMGIGVGRVPHDICVKQMLTAIKEVMLGIGGMPNTFLEAQEQHQSLYNLTEEK